MNIKVCNFAKKENSTAQPLDASLTTLTCKIKTPCSIQAPVVELASATVPSFNYAYIPDMGRYYYVTGVAYNRGIWEISMRVDPMASFKTDIGSASMYILRSSAQSNGYLMDPVYPMSNASSASSATVKAASSYSSGSIIINVANGDTNTGTTSYVMTLTEFGKFLDCIMVDGQNQTSIWDSLNQAIQVTTYDPSPVRCGFPYPTPDI